MSFLSFLEALGHPRLKAELLLPYSTQTVPLPRGSPGPYLKAAAGFYLTQKNADMRTRQEERLATQVIFKKLHGLGVGAEIQQ